MGLNPSVTEVARNFAAYINRVAFRGERFVLMRGDKPVAELRPIPTGKALGDLPGLLASLPRLSAEDAETSSTDLAHARADLSRTVPRDPWPS